MRRIIDLTHPITDGMPVFPGDPPVCFEPMHTIKDGGYNVTRICAGTHSGTHVDVPHHCMYHDRSVDRLPLDVLVGWAEVLDLTNKGPKSEITAADLDAFADRIYTGARILLKTNWSKRLNEPDFFTDYPGLTEGAVMWLNARKVRLVGLEQPSTHPSHHLEVHKALLTQGVVLLESLANLDQLTLDRVYLVALPLNLLGADGSPMRVIAMEGVEISE